MNDSFLHIPKRGLLLPGRGLILPREVDLTPLRDRKGKLHMPVMGGAWTASGMFVPNVIDIVDATQLAIDLSLTSHKWALYTNSKTPNFSSDTAYNTTAEVSGTGYTAGGRTIATGGGSPTVTESPTGTVMYDQDDMTWPTSTITARGAELYADALAGDNLIVGCNFGSDIVSTAGTFAIGFSASGVIAWDITP